MVLGTAYAERVAEAQAFLADMKAEIKVEVKDQVHTTLEVTCVIETPPKVNCAIGTNIEDEYEIPVATQKTCMKSVVFDWDSNYKNIYCTGVCVSITVNVS